MPRLGEEQSQTNTPESVAHYYGIRAQKPATGLSLKAGLMHPHHHQAL